MDPLQRANQLVNDTNAIMSRPERDAAFWKASQAKSVEISDFLAEYGSSLDAAGSSFMVDALGNCVDALAKGAASTVGEANTSFLGTAFDSYMSDPKKLDAEHFKDAAKAAGDAVGGSISEALKAFLKTPGGKVTAVIVVAAVVAYFWRAIK